MAMPGKVAKTAKSVIDDPLVDLQLEVRRVIPDATFALIKGLREKDDIPTIKIGRAHFARRSRVEALVQRLLAATA